VSSSGTGIYYSYYGTFTVQAAEHERIIQWTNWNTKLTQNNSCCIHSDIILEAYKSVIKQQHPAEVYSVLRAASDPESDTSVAPFDR